MTVQEDEVLEARFFHADEIPHNLLWGHRQRIQNAFHAQAEASVWLQHVPYDPATDRQALYKLLSESGLPAQEFYSRYFGWGDPVDDRLEIGSVEPDDRANSDSDGR